MIVLGLILWILGVILSISVLSNIGIAFMVVGVILLLLGWSGKTVYGRRYWW